MMKRYESWGRLGQSKHSEVIDLWWRSEIPNLHSIPNTVLPYGLGRSYGDSCLNRNGVLLDTSKLNKFILFDTDNGLLQCEAGSSFADILPIIVPRGWFLPVTPGTKFVTVGGAIANDVHGKNHHCAGTFGRYVKRFELLRSDGQRLICSKAENTDLFKATIGGLGLTGLITWAEFELTKMPGMLIEQEKIRFKNIDQFIQLSEESEKSFEYIVAWADFSCKGNGFGKGILIRGNHAVNKSQDSNKYKDLPGLKIPPFSLRCLLNRWTIKAFNHLYYFIQKQNKESIHYDDFFYPLDKISNWNKFYGKHGFYQYQCVLPYDQSNASLINLINTIKAAEQTSTLTVLKVFGNIKSPGFLSFPRKGVAIALDFVNKGQKTLSLLKTLDRFVLEAGGALYPAKDARMSPNLFKASFPDWEKFSQYVDSSFSSELWRRVIAT